MLGRRGPGRTLRRHEWREAGYETRTARWPQARLGAASHSSPSRLVVAVARVEMIQSHSSHDR
eukprot:3341330-Prymnesium_polylepis.1